jgi:hypothetical protein
MHDPDGGENGPDCLERKLTQGCAAAAWRAISPLQAYTVFRLLASFPAASEQISCQLHSLRPCFRHPMVHGQARRIDILK